MNEQSLYCIDYLLACIEYLDFYQMMIEYKVINIVVT